VHSVSQKPNPRHLGEPLGRAKSLLEVVSCNKTMEGMGKGRVVNGNEFRTAGSATLKPWEEKVVKTRGTDSRLVFAERRERVGV